MQDDPLISVLVSLTTVNRTREQCIDYNDRQGHEYIFREEKFSHSALHQFGAEENDKSKTHDAST